MPDLLTPILLTFGIAAGCGFIAGAFKVKSRAVNTAVRWGFGALALAATLYLWT
jgi:hypothetical protein